MVERRAPLADAHALPAGRAGGLQLEIVERRGLGFIQVGAYDAPGMNACAAELSRVVQAPVSAAPGASTSAGDVTVLWGGLRRWALVAADPVAADLAARLQVALAGQAQIVDLGHARVPLRIGGGAARALLAKGSLVDFHPGAFPVGRVAHTSLAHLSAVVHLRDAKPSFDLWVHRSTVVDFHEWLETASREFARSYAIEQA